MSSPWSILKTPVSAEQLAVHGGSPASTMTLEGTVRRAEVIETFGISGILPAAGARFGDPLILDGVTIWIEGYFPTDEMGEPVVMERSEIITIWQALYEKLLSEDLEFYLHYVPGDDPLFRKYLEVNTVLLRTGWADALGMPYQLAAITSNHSVSPSEPGEL